MNGRITIAILAAGSASRFGGNKLDADFLGKPLGEHVLDAALGLDMGKPLIVAGDPAPAFAREATGHRCARLAINREARLGLASSIALAAGLARAARSEALLLLLADMPMVSLATLARLVAACTAARQPAAVLHEPGKPGIPACFPAGWLAMLERLEGDRGAAGLLRECAHAALIAVPPAELADIDTPQDLAGLKARHRL